MHHWLGALFYIYCLITGLAFWSPYMYWLAAIVGGGPTARFWHPWFGLAFTVSMLWMYKMWGAIWQTTDADLRWKKAIKHYIENDDQNLPPEGRFNYGQKLFFWLMFYGVILLLISGVGLWFVGVDSVESALAALSGGDGARGGGAGHDRRVHHSRVHGHGDGARRILLRLSAGEVSTDWARRITGSGTSRSRKAELPDEITPDPFDQAT